MYVQLEATQIDLDNTLVTLTQEEIGPVQLEVPTQRKTGPVHLEGPTQ